MLLIKNVTIVDPRSKHHGKKRDIHIRNGKIESIKSKIDIPKVKVLDGTGAMVSIGWLDVGVQTGDPGFEHREDLRTVSAAAAAGGYTGIACWAKHFAYDSFQIRSFVFKKYDKNNLVDLFPIGAVSQNCKGVDITEMYDMHHAGAVAFSDGKKAIQNSGFDDASFAICQSF